MAAAFYREGYFAVCGVLDENDPVSIRKTYSVIEDESGRIHRLIEKPRNPFTGVKGTGNCIFRKEILNYIQYTPIHYLRKEKELPGLLQEAIDDGERIFSFRYCQKYLNVNHYEELERFVHEHSLSFG
jgi:NDP-sugar pyrophosphorylase family protein